MITEGDAAIPLETTRRALLMTRFKERISKRFPEKLVLQIGQVGIIPVSKSFLVYNVRSIL